VGWSETVCWSSSDDGSIDDGVLTMRVSTIKLIHRSLTSIFLLLVLMLLLLGANRRREGWWVIGCHEARAEVGWEVQKGATDGATCDER
jgi:hypothetical protein